MRRSSEVAKRYAKALYQLSSAGDHTEKPAKILEELKVFEKVFIKDTDTRRFLCSPVVSPEEKQAVVSSLESVLPSISRFLMVLVEADRIESFREIVSEFEKISEEASGELSVKLETARKFSDGTVEEIKNLLEQQWRRKVRFETSINPELLGGFVASASGKSMNASALAQLESLGEQLVSA